jgi:hypothetical protein
LDTERSATKQLIFQKCGDASGRTVAVVQAYRPQLCAAAWMAQCKNRRPRHPFVVLREQPTSRAAYVNRWMPWFGGEIKRKRQRADVRRRYRVQVIAGRAYDHGKGSLRTYLSFQPRRQDGQDP